MTNVVKMWRQRGVLLGRRAWTCTGCGRPALVKRRVCAGCGQAAPLEQRRLPATGTVVAATSAGAAVEHLDQVTGRKDAVLVEIEGGLRLPCLLASSDSALLPALEGETVRLSVRKQALGETSSDEPIAYVIKASVDLATRQAIKNAETAKKAEENN
jgi:hypothetical protein